MKRLIKTGLLAGLAFAATTLVTERTADACEETQDQCATLVDPTDPTVTYHSQTTVSYATTNSNCGCSAALVLPAGDVAGTVFVDAAGNPAQDFCGAGFHGPTGIALQKAFQSLPLSGAVLAAVGAGGVASGAGGYIVSKIVNNPNHQSPTAIVTAQINFGPGGSVSVDNKHQAAAPVAACTDCSLTPFTANCIAAAQASTLFDAPVPYRTACARTDAVELLGLDQPPDEDGGGCSVPGGRGSIGGLLLVMVGLAFSVVRRRRS